MMTERLTRRDGQTPWHEESKTNDKDDAENQKILEYSVTKSNLLLPSCVGSPSTSQFSSRTKEVIKKTDGLSSDFIDCRDDGDSTSAHNNNDSINTVDSIMWIHNNWQWPSNNNDHQTKNTDKYFICWRKSRL
jgi:hypothetical protein